MKGPFPRGAVVWLVKRRYMGKDLVSDRYGRYFDIPLRLSQLGFRIDVLALSYRGEPVGQVEINPFLALTSLDLRHGWRYLSAARTMLARRVDVVVGASDTQFCVLAWILARRRGLPFVCDIYDNFDTYGSARIPGLSSLYYRALVRSAVNVVFEESLADYLASRTGTRNFRVVPNAVDGSLFRPIAQERARARLGLPKDRPLVGYFGAVSPDRGFATVLEAFGSVQRSQPDISLIVAGRSDIQLPEGGGGVRYLGARAHADVPMLIAACDVCLVSYRDDAFARYSFPTKALEYVACRRPFLAPAVGGAVRVFRDHPEYLYAVGDSRDLAEKLSFLLGRRTFNFPDLPDLDATATQYAAILDDVVQRVRWSDVPPSRRGSASGYGGR